MVGSPHAFPRHYRLLKSGQFKNVFGGRLKSADSSFSVHARVNGLAHPRLGITVSRRVSPKASERNRIKRIVRNTFRMSHQQLASIDIVVIARSAAALKEQRALDSSLRRHLTRVSQKCVASSAG